MTKPPTLFITIPALNEAQSIGQVINSVPKKIKGINDIKTLVWDDGSSDDTAQVAKQAGADYVFSNKKKFGLAKTFTLATNKAVELGADIIVNTDADNQYDQTQIPLLIEPILKNKADIVNGDRQVDSLTHMPPSKKYGNMLGTWWIRTLTSLTIKDASSGFRAYTKEAIQALHLMSEHTYTHESLIQAAFKDLVITEIPITFHPRAHGQSRLILGLFPHIKKSLSTIIRTILMYRAFKYLVTLGLFFMLLGFIGVIRFIYLYIIEQGAGHVQSLIISSILISIGFNTILMGVLADLISINRKIKEQ